MIFCVVTNKVSFRDTCLFLNTKPGRKIPSDFSFAHCKILHLFVFSGELALVWEEDGIQAESHPRPSGAITVVLFIFFCVEVKSLSNQITPRRLTFPIFYILDIISPSFC